MRYSYGEFDGSDFPTPDQLFAQNQMMDLIMQYGDQALKAMQQAMNKPDNPTSELLEQMLQEGLFDKDGKGKLKLTPKAVTKMQGKALMEIFKSLKTGSRDGHEKTTPGAGGERIEGTKPYTFGDPVSELDLHATLRNAMRRASSEQRPAVPIQFNHNDMELHLHEGTTTCSTVVLIDLSGSMTRYGRYMSAKRVALALLALVRQRFPQDTVDFIGFYSGANVIPEMQLPLIMPKPVTIFDYQVRLKIKLDQLEQGPQHFTNLHMGLQSARRLLRKRSGENKQIFIITDGEPTAHVEGDYAYLLYPPDQRSAVATLKEAVMAAKEGVRLSTFALIEDYYGMDWVSFVDQMTKLTKGVAFYTASGELANCVIESYLSGRKRKKAIAG
jgi:Ca-activated chloride channel homolog